MIETTRRWLVGGALLGTALLTMAACSSSSKSSNVATATTVPPTAAPSTTAAAAAGVTVSAAQVGTLGTVLVNGQGRTLYILTSEKGNKITCTDANGCTKVWPDNELPKGTLNATGGPGVQASLLGTATNAAGDHYASYATYPLYTFSQDKAAGDANGEGITSFGGTWEAITPAGTPVAPPGAAPTSKTTASGAYGY